MTSCPSNLGTGMRASVHVKVPNLTSDGTDLKAKEAAKPLGLSVRGTGGEHTPIGADGTIDLSPSNRLFITEAEIITKLYNGELGIENHSTPPHPTPTCPVSPHPTSLHSNHGNLAVTASSDGNVARSHLCSEQKEPLAM